MQRFALFLSVMIHLGVATSAGDQVATAEISTVIDRFIEDRQQSESIAPTVIVDDYTFARRATLDLAGRVPTLNELTDFIESTSSDKRREYVQRLLESPDFAFHLRNSLDIMLLARLKNDDAWREYLLEATRENRSWDRIFHEILLPEQERPDDNGPAAFLHARAKDLDSMTNDASVLLFGINIACAKCHDHPLVDDWQQRHYFGLASFFQRTFPTRTGLVSEKFDGRLRFTTTDGEELQAEFVFLTGASVSEPGLALDNALRKEINAKIRDAQRKDDAPPPPQPEFSPRAELVRLALAPGEQDLFSRNIVNRIWARLMGRGLVHPLDQMHSENPASHPELLETLAKDFAQNGYDLKRLIRSIMLSRAYARSSHWSDQSEPPATDLFARGQARPLSPWQLSLSLRIATRDPNHVRGVSEAAQWEQQREQLEQQAATMTARLPIPSDAFQVGTDEALLFNNSEDFHSDYLASGDGQLVSYLGEMNDDDHVIETAFRTVLSRPPTATELGAVTLHLAQRPEQRIEGIRQLVWALLASPEFRFNH